MRHRQALTLWLLGAALGLVGLVFERTGANGVDRMALIVTASQGTAIVAVSLVGLVVARRQSGNALGWLYLSFWILMGLGALASGYGRWATLIHPGAYGGTFAVWLHNWFWVPALGLLLSFPFLLFPDGHLPSPKWRLVGWWSAFAIATWSIAFAFEGHDYTDSTNRHATTPYTPDGLVSFFDVMRNVGAVLFFTAVVLCLASLFARFRRGSEQARAQIKWLFLAGTITLGYLMLPPERGNNGWIDVLMGPVLVLIPISVGIAILRYRLYDIDRIISRTTSYAMVTGLLLATYLVVVTLASSLLPDSSNSLAVAAATLAAAALARPALNRIQALVDRRFNRARYDAQHTVDAFGNRLRSEVELATVTDDLVGAVHATLAPSNVALWIRGTS